MLISDSISPTTLLSAEGASGLHLYLRCLRGHGPGGSRELRSDCEAALLLHSLRWGQEQCHPTSLQPPSHQPCQSHHPQGIHCPGESSDGLCRPTAFLAALGHSAEWVLAVKEKGLPQAQAAGSSTKMCAIPQHLLTRNQASSRQEGRAQAAVILRVDVGRWQSLGGCGHSVLTLEVDTRAYPEDAGKGGGVQGADVFLEGEGLHARTAGCCGSLCGE